MAAAKRTTKGTTERKVWDARENIVKYTVMSRGARCRDCRADC